jgi:DtxR family Mn-dependent transcriptional regulator
MGSGAVENYLKAIYKLETRFGKAKTSALALKLGVTAGSVTDMLKRLAAEESGLVHYQSHQGVRLTARGRQKALDVIRRHRLLETFLHRVLGLSWADVHQEAEILEHHVSHRVMEAIDRVLDYPRFDPHGESIPRSGGDLPAANQRPLADIEAGGRVRIARVQPSSDDFLRYLDTIGIGIGTTGTVLEKAPFDGPILFQKSDADAAISLGKSVAEQLFVTVVDS